MRVFLPLTPAHPDPKPGSVPPHAAVLALGQDTVKPNQKIVEVTGQIRAGDPPGARGKVTLAVPEMCDTGHKQLECCAGQGLQSGGVGKQQEGHGAFSHFPAFLDDAELWKMLACLVSPHKRQGLG